ncbi:uncharacterized protein LOC121413199 isoform X1 [Lytechinus variegatus]|uniref:uncharacterized protein LOC121413199 isoform X1 n=1 Tax=Lytechinus variegatus TaxID=7654 RepID=UPI001BB16AEA|nr:uncharacterized protein LOC121413199 isoform X1 [Lytechinus variegatus]
MRLAKTLKCSSRTEYEVTSICAKALSNKNETMNGCFQLKDSLIEGPSNTNSQRNYGSSEFNMESDCLDETERLDGRIFAQEVFHNYNVYFTEDSNETVNNNLHDEEIMHVNENEPNLKDSVDSNDYKKLKIMTKIENSNSILGTKRKLTNPESGLKCNDNFHTQIHNSKFAKLNETDLSTIGEIDYDTNDDLMIIEESQSILWFKPLVGKQKKKCCEIINIPHFVASLENYAYEKWVPLEQPKDVKDIEDDGNCFYRAISFALTGSEEYHLIIRQAILTHLMENEDRFVGFLRMGYSSISHYVSSNDMEENGTWATEMEIMVLANLIETDIYVYDEDRLKWSLFSGKNVQIGKETTTYGVYLRNTHGIHYDVVMSVQSCDSSFSCNETTNISSSANDKERKYARVNNVKISDLSMKRRRSKRSYSVKKDIKKKQKREERSFKKKKDMDIEKLLNYEDLKITKKYEDAGKRPKMTYDCNKKYHTDSIYRITLYNLLNEKYRLNKVFRENRKETTRKCYQTNEELKQSQKSKMRNTMRSKYHSDEQFKQSQKSRMKNTMKSKYHSDEQFKQSQKSRMKNTMKSKYHSDEQFKQSHKNKIRNKYQSDEHFQQSHKNKIRNKYQSDEQFQQSHKNKIRNKYQSDEQFQQSYKNKIRNKYQSDEQFQQPHKNTMRNKYQKDYSFKQRKLLSLKSKYQKNNSYREQVKKHNIKRNVKKELEMSQFDNVLQEFQKIISHGPEYVCCVCLKLLFENQVMKCNKSKYKLQTCISEKYLHVCNSTCQLECQIGQSVRSSLWICYTCHRKLQCGKVPAEAHTNNLHLHDIPEELANLNTLEQHLIALNIPFMKMMSLPKGGQNGVHGPVVCVPSNTIQTVQILPRHETEDQLIRVKLKRKLSFKSYYEYKFVDKSKLLNALSYLKMNNKYYRDVLVNDEWENSMEKNEEENESEEVSSVCDISNLKKFRRRILDCLDEYFPKDVESSHGKKKENSVSVNNKPNDEDDDDVEERLNGIHLNSCLQPADIGQEILDQYFDDIICCAPCEGKSPVSVLQDETNEAKCFPVLFPQGQPTFHDKRNEKLTLGRYLHNRLMHVDNRFAQNTDFIFYAQYIYEIQQVLSQVSIALRQSKNTKDNLSPITAKDLKDAEKIQNILKADKGYKFLKQIRGTPPYWQKTQKDVLAMVRQLGKPTWFASFSCADMRWPELLNTFLCQIGDSRKLSELDWADKCKLIRSNPVTVARMFDHRFHMFMNKVIMSTAAPVGRCIDYITRIEFQSRGSSHVHLLMWVEQAPQLGIDKDDDVIQFIDKYISCRKPDKEEDPELYEIVSSVQQHSKKHSKSCKKKGTTCRFNFPRPPSEKTFIIKPVEDTEVKDKKTKQKNKNETEGKKSEKTRRIEDAKQLLNSVKDALSGGTEYNSVRDLFEKLGITQNQFESAHNEIASQESVIIQREPQDVWVNQYNPQLLRAWNANMDLQYVTNAYACVAYIVSYMSKAEREMGMLLSHTLSEMEEGNTDAKQSMKKLGQAYMHNREVSAQESVYRVCSLRLKESSRKVEFIPVGPDPVRMSLPLSVINNRPECDDDEDNIWMPSKLDRYKARPKTKRFSAMCLATFCSEYRILTKSQITNTCKENIFKLDENLGYVQKRTRGKDAVVRYPRFSVVVSPEKYFLSILQLFFPHYDDEHLKPPGFESYQNFYETGVVKIHGSVQKVSLIVCTNRKKFEINAESIDQAQAHLEEFGVQEDAWSLLCPESEVERLEHPKQNIDLEDCDENLDIPDLKNDSKSENYSLELRSSKISKTERHCMIRNLNETQMLVFYKIREWCLNKVNGKMIEPFHVFITGGAGTGKSHLVKCLYYESTRILARMLHYPDDISVLKIAPTGVAAYNINGHTIHSILSIPIRAQMPYQPLSEEKISALRNKLAQLQILIIDEVSMVDQKLLYYIHSRLRQIKQSRDETPFGGVSVIAVGDMYQLPPVFGNPLYKDSLQGVLWNDNFKTIELQQIMRQKDDTEFALLLNRLRIKERDDVLNDRDLSMLKSCETGEECEDALHIYSCNKEVDEWNKKLLHKKCANVICLKAEDTEKDAKNGSKIRENPVTRCKSQLPNYLWIAVNARVMLLKNIDVSKGLTNGCFGNVTEIIKSNSKTICIKVHFDRENVGIHSIERCEEFLGKKYARKQFPLKLAYACTIHKVQGLTLDKAVVSLKRIFDSGQAYVGLSRVSSLSGLTLENFKPQNIHCNPEIKERMKNMKVFIENVENENDDNYNFTLILHNIQGLKQHFIDLQSQCQFMNADIICLTETWINDDDICDVNIQDFKFYHQPRHHSYNESGILNKFKDQSHGGVGIYTKKQTSSRLDICIDNLEFIATVITDPISIVISVVYRPPSYNITSFCESLRTLLDKLSKQTTKCIITGDFNEDLLKGTSKIHQLMCLHGYTQHVVNATTENGTLIDHVYSIGLDSLKTEIIPMYYSYHEGIKVMF